MEYLEREFAACRGVMAGYEFCEGVRAAIIDKDPNPRWSPATSDEVRESDIEAYLGATAEPDLPARARV